MSLSTVSAALFLAGASIDGGAVPCERATDIAVPAIPATFNIEAAQFVHHGSVVGAPTGPGQSTVQLSESDSAVDPAQGTKTPQDEEIIVTGRVRVKEDPVQELNMASFQVVQAVDQNVVRPVAMAYSNTIPGPIRDGVRNFLDHLTEPVNAVNYLLQFKIGRAFETVGRFAINSTLGVLGIFDIARRKPFRLPYRQNGFADTMGFYGVKSGAFLYLPLIGPTTVRDLIGVVLNRSFLPAVAGRPFNRPEFYIPASTFGQLDKRAQLDEDIERRRIDNRGAYTATREDYLERRQIQIDALRGKFNPKYYPPPKVVPTLPNK